MTKKKVTKKHSAEEVKAKEGEIHTGDVKWNAGEKTLHCPNAKHPKMAESEKAFNGTKKKFTAAFNKAMKKRKGELQAELSKLKAANKESKGSYELAKKAALGNADALKNEKLDTGLMKEIQGAFSKHLGEEFGAFETAQKELHGVRSELNTAVKNAIAAADPEKIKGPKEAIKKSHEFFSKEAKATKWMGRLRADGVKEAFSHNLGSKAWEASKGKTLLKGGGVIVGLGAMIDAATRGEKKGEDGQLAPRSAIGRWTEFVLGAGLATGSALGGRRV